MIRKFRLTNGAGDGWDLNSRDPIKIRVNDKL